MLADAGASLVIVGHSERRAAYGETDAKVAAKALAARRAGLEPIICVGEIRAERDAGRAIDIICGQVAGCVARRCRARARLRSPTSRYGRSATGVTPTAAEIAEAHAALRGALIDCAGDAGAAVADPLRRVGEAGKRGGDPAIAEVGGALVGGASLKAADFLAIVRAAPGEEAS